MTSGQDRFIQWENIRMVPILHNKMEFAVEVRRQFQAYEPDLVAVEFPETLGRRIIRGVRRLPLLSVVYYEESDGVFNYLLIEPTDGQVEAIRGALAGNIPVHFIDRDTEGYPRDMRSMPDSYAVGKIGLSSYYQAYLKVSDSIMPNADDILREKTMAYHLQGFNKGGYRVLFVGGLFHFPRLLTYLDQPQVQVIGRKRRAGVRVAHLHRDSSRELLTEMPFLCAAFEKARNGGEGKGVDRLEVHAALIRLAKSRHWKNSREEVSPTQRRILNKFARNQALLSGRLVPSFYQFIVASRGAVDDNFAYEVWDLGSHYPWQTDTPELPVLRLEGKDLFLDERKITFHRRLKSLRTRLVPVPVKKRQRERHPGEWKAHFRGHAICSYPPEDVAIEGYGRYVMKKALDIKTEENIRIEPFTRSLLDGIDIKETIRQWDRGQVYVREQRPLKGKVGSVVVIFDPDTREKNTDEAFPWRVTWLGEHAQESDMAFYSTPAGEIMDGPGISRCHYGGFMLTYPPMRVYDIWKDSFFNSARNKPERLLMAALDYCLEKHVAYVSPSPPSGWCRSLAEKLGKKIIYIPLGTLSPVAIKKLRRFHVLDGHHVRRYAHHFIP